MAAFLPDRRFLRCFDESLDRRVRSAHGLSALATAFVAEKQVLQKDHLQTLFVKKRAFDATLSPIPVV